MHAAAAECGITAESAAYDVEFCVSALVQDAAAIIECIVIADDTIRDIGLGMVIANAGAKDCVVPGNGAVFDGQRGEIVKDSGGIKGRAIFDGRAVTREVAA